MLELVRYPISKERLETLNEREYWDYTLGTLMFASMVDTSASRSYEDDIKRENQRMVNFLRYNDGLPAAQRVSYQQYCDNLQKEG